MLRVQIKCIPVVILMTMHLIGQEIMTVNQDTYSRSPFYFCYMTCNCYDVYILVYMYIIHDIRIYMTGFVHVRM